MMAKLNDGPQKAGCAKLVDYPDSATPGGSQLQPEVAKSIDVSADGLEHQHRCSS